MEYDEMIPAAIIGCGWVAGGYDWPPDDVKIRTHANAISCCDQTELIAVVDIDLAKATTFAKNWGGQVYTDIDQMLEQAQPSLVSVCAPDAEHSKILDKLLLAQSVDAVWCEKPMVTDIDDGKRILDAYRSSEKLLLINYQRAYATGYRKLSNEIKTGEYGKITKAIVYYTKGIIHNGSHAMELFLDWFGEPTQFNRLGYTDRTGLDTTIDARMEFGKIPVYFIGLKEHDFSLFEIQLYTEKARISLVNGGSEKIIQWVSNPVRSGHRYLSEPVIEDMGLDQAMRMTLDYIISIMNKKNSWNKAYDHTKRALDALQFCLQMNMDD